jgi:D-amino-acid dehydrogenase
MAGCGAWNLTSNATSADVVVIGSGVTGLFSALALAERGLSVTVLGAGPAGGGASSNNAGWITRAFCEPLPGPGVLGESVRSVLRRGGPLHLRPRLDPGFLSWLSAFWLNCSSARFAAGAEALIRLSQDSFKLYDGLARDHAELQYHRTGILLACRTPRALEQLRGQVQLMRRHGWDDEVGFLDAAGLAAAEPALQDGMAGGVLAVQDGYLFSPALISALVSRLAVHAVAVEADSAVTSLEYRGDRVTAVRTTGGAVNAGAALIAAGVWTPGLARLVGARIPVEAGKGYVLDYEPPPIRLRRPLYLFDDRLAVSPLRDSVRVAGTMELSGINTKVQGAKVSGIAAAMSRQVRGWPDSPSTARLGSGMRPVTPDGLPVIGPVPGFGNLYVATGHAMLGITLGPVTGQLVAAMIHDGTLPDAARPFSAARFERAKR